MKKILALILALCMCIAVLVACDNKDTETETETKAETTEKETEADTKKPSSTDDDEEEDDEDEGGEEGDGTIPDPSEISIGSVAEWEALATAGDPDKEDFLNKTVKLTANIDFGTATATTLFKTFAGTFDGGNFTIKGKTASRMSLLANTLDGATVKNVTVDGFAISCPVDGAENTSVIAANAMTSNTTAENPTVTFENITVKNCSIDADKAAAGSKGVGFILGEAKNINVAAKNIIVTACTVTAANKNSSRIGGVVGFMMTSGLSTFEEIKVDMNVNAHSHLGGIIGRSEGPGNLHIEKINVTGTFSSPGNTGGSEGLGGVIGSKYNEATASGDSYVKNAYINVKLFQTSGSGRAGGIGNWYKNNNSSANLTIENCYVAGEISVMQNATTKNRAGGLFGEYGAKNSTLTLKNVVVAAAVEQTYAGSDTATPPVTPDVTKLGVTKDASLINYASAGTAYTLAATDCYTTIVKNSNDEALTLTEGFTAVAADKTAAMVTLDASGYVSAIKAPSAS